MSRPLGTRGWFGVVIYRPKTSTNVGSLLRTADILGVNMFVTIGARYKKQATDTMAAIDRVPLLHFDDFDTFKEHRPFNCPLVGVELVDGAIDLRRFHHPERALYMVGAEDDGIPPKVLEQCQHVIRLAGSRSMNVAVAGSIVLYHREALQRAREDAAAAKASGA